MAYFGDFVPNSVITKSFTPNSFTISLGANYLLRFILESALYSGLVAVSMVYTAHISIKERIWRSYRNLYQDDGRIIIVASNIIIIVSFMVVLRNGGDWMPYYRLLFLYGPLYCVIMAILLKKRVISSYLGIAVIILFSSAFLSIFGIVWRKKGLANL